MAIVSRKGLGPAKRFGTRYGSPLKMRLALVEIEQKQKHECPYCGRPKVRRVMAGVWQCQKCQTKFTGRAYTPMSKLAQTQEVQAVTSEPEEQKEQEEEVVAE